MLVVHLQGGGCHRRLAAVPLWLFALLALPNAIIGRTGVVDLRRVLFPTMLLIAATAFTPTRRVWAAAVIAAGMVGVLARRAVLVPEWRLHDAHVQSFRVIDGVVARGGRVLVASAPETPRSNCRERYYWPPFDEHIPSLLVIDRGAFVSTLFAVPGLQPIEPRHRGTGVRYHSVKCPRGPAEFSGDPGPMLVGESMSFRLYRVVHPPA